MKRVGGALGAAALIAGSLALTAPAHAVPSASSDLDCAITVFGTTHAMDWNPRVLSSSGVSENGKSQIKLKLSDIDGQKLPVPMVDYPFTATVKATVNGEAVEFKGSSKLNGAARAPIPVPELVAEVGSTLTAADVVITEASFNVAAGAAGNFPFGCPGTGAANWQLPSIPVTPGTLTPTPTTTPSPTTSPSPTATKTPTPTKTPTEEPKEQEGSPAKGSVTFDCTLQTIGSPFTYAPKVTLEGARADADSDEVSLRLTLSDIAKTDGKGLAPVPMDADMTITATAEVDGEEVDFTGKSRVNVGMYEPVPVPVMTAKADIVAATVPVKITAFKFDFGEMAGTQWFSDCKGSGSLSKMTIGVGELNDDGNGGSNGGSGTNGAGSTTLPRTGGGDAMPVIGLWALALGVAGAGLLVWLPRQRRTAN